MRWGVNLEGLTEVRLGNHKGCVTANVPTMVVSFSCSNIITRAKKKIHSWFPLPRKISPCSIATIKFFLAWVPIEPLPTGLQAKSHRACFLKYKITSHLTGIIFQASISVYMCRFSIQTPHPSGCLSRMPSFLNGKVIRGDQVSWPSTSLQSSRQDGRQIPVSEARQGMRMQRDA